MLRKKRGKSKKSKGKKKKDKSKNPFNCSPGYELVNEICVDIDECANGTHDCIPDTEVCSNMAGSYSCLCMEGYERIGGDCMDIDECLDGSHDCLPDEEVCSNIPGSYSCVCAEGYERVDGFCICNQETCEGECVDEICECPLGFAHIDGLCVDIDECTEDTHSCNLETETCVNADGSFRCLNPIVDQLLSSGVSGADLELFHEDVFNLVAADSPTGFCHGQTTFDLGAIEPGPPFFKAKDSMIILQGTFFPSDGIVQGDTRVRVYSQAGLHVESAVDLSGRFSFTLTDIVPGLMPFLMIFSSPSFDGNQNWRSDDPSGLVFWTTNEMTNSTSLTFKLSWNKPTSDLDLYVTEPSGTIVNYDNISGDYGELDVDNVDGFGPEHYTSLLAPPGRAFVAKVYLHNVGGDVLPIQYSLDAYYSSRLLQSYSGSLDYVGQFSEDLPVTVIETDGRSRGECPVDKFPFWCEFWFCTEEKHAKASWKWYNVITEMENREDILFAVHTMLTPFLKTPNSQSYLSLAAAAIRNGEGDFACLKHRVLEIYCKMEYTHDLESYLKAVNVGFFAAKKLVRKIVKSPITKYVIDYIGVLINSSLKIGASTFAAYRDLYAMDNVMLTLFAQLKYECGFNL